MKRKYFTRALMAVFCMGGALTSCTDNDEGTKGNPPVDWDEAYVIAATVDDASYLVVSRSLDEGA